MVEFPVMLSVIVHPARKFRAYTGPDEFTATDGDKPSLRRADLRNLAIVVAGVAGLVLLVSPQHEFPIIDDYLYVGSVKDMLATSKFVMPDFSQANLVGLTVAGTLWTKLFGFSFTSLTYLTLVFATVGLLAFYGIAREGNVPPGSALLGTALLGLNPIFVHLSYSFMTDVPFISMVLVSCYLYIRGLKPENSLLWLLAGGLCAGYAFLIRQYGLFVPVAFLIYLLANGLLTRSWRWRQMLAVAVLPALIVGGWLFLMRGTPPTGGAMAAAARAASFRFKEPWLRVFLLRAFTIFPLTALSAWAAVKIRPARWWLAGVLAVAVWWAMFAVDLPDEKWIAVYQLPFAVQVGPLAFNLPDEPFSFAAEGNIIKTDAIDFDEFGYAQEPVWTMEAWRAIWVVGATLGVVLLAKIAWALWDWLRALFEAATAKVRKRKDGAKDNPKSLEPIAAFYLLGAMIFVVSLAFPGDMFDRYILGFLPFLILFLVRGCAQWGRLGWGYSIAALLIIASFTILAKADHMDQMRTRWEAGLWMEARVGAVQVGWNWDHWGHATSDVYLVTGVPVDGFRTERQFPYLCRLCGFTTRYVLAQSRLDTPPIPNP
jgi:4-amino-4-deoxy-L-arabinose transferase-like glycosyltransferase